VRASLNVSTALGCGGLDSATTLDCMRNKSATEIALALVPSSLGGPISWNPCIDGYERSTQVFPLFRAGRYAHAMMTNSQPAMCASQWRFAEKLIEIPSMLTTLFAFATAYAQRQCSATDHWLVR
jgi:hypothetical protein